MTDDPKRPPSVFHNVMDNRTWKCMPGGVFVWETMDTLIAAGVAPEGSRARRWSGGPGGDWGPDWVDPTHGPFPRRDVALNAMSDAWGERDGVVYVSTPGYDNGAARQFFDPGPDGAFLGPECFEMGDGYISLTQEGVRRLEPHITAAWEKPLRTIEVPTGVRVHDEIFYESSLTTGRLSADWLSKLPLWTEGFPMRRTNRLKTWKNTCVTLGFACALQCLAAWGVALVTDFPQAWVASLWFLGAGLLFELAAYLLALLERRK